MKPFYYPAIIVGAFAWALAGFWAGLGFGLAVFFYSKHQYCSDMMKDRALLQEIRQDLQYSRLTGYR